MSLCERFGESEWIRRIRMDSASPIRFNVLIWRLEKEYHLSSHVIPKHYSSGIPAIAKRRHLSTEPNNPQTASREDLRLAAESLCWRCDPSALNFESTADVEPVTGIVGQDDAMEALRFGLEFSGEGQNIFVRGLAGTGRMTLLRQLVEEIRPSCPNARDRCYVHNFSQPDRSRLITLPRGKGSLFRARVDRLIDFIKDDLHPSLSSDTMRALRARLDEQAQAQMKQLGKPFEDELQNNNLALVPLQVGQTVQPVILPLIEGKPTPLEHLQQLRSQGQISEEETDRILEKITAFSKRFQEISEKIQEIQTKHKAAVQELYENEARAILMRQVIWIEREFPEESVKAFLKELVEDLVTQRLRTLEQDDSYKRLYKVNLLLSRGSGDTCPIVIENTPTLQNLLGQIEREVGPGGAFHTDHLMIQAGSLLQADGGYLILEARDVLVEPGAWKVLLRTLRTGKLEIVPSELMFFWTGPTLKPEPIEINVKVVLLGDPELYGMLDAYDPDFPYLFKVLADFDTTIAREEKGIHFYAGILSKIAREENLIPFSRGAVTGLVEYGARIAARRGRLTTRFGRLADIAREAAFIAGKSGSNTVRREDVQTAVTRTRRRADLPARKFRKLVSEGLIRIQAQGAAIGQINGLAVIHAGPLTYGFPTRITATIGPGTAGAINIEREAQLSGAIHTKGFYILGGLLRHLLRTEHPLAFSASIAFEQSYGGIDGDSASGAEGCCLLSALTGIPLRQDLAITGAIDQLGHIQSVGAVTEKVEGFFDTCNALGLTGTQGVIIPKPNAGDLMLRSDVVEACEAGRFHVYAVGTIHEALELFTGRKAGDPDPDGIYPEGTVLYEAVRKAGEYWSMASGNGSKAEIEGEEEDEEEENPASA